MYLLYSCFFVSSSLHFSAYPANDDYDVSTSPARIACDVVAIGEVEEEEESANSVRTVGGEKLSASTKVMYGAAEVCLRDGLLTIHA